MGGEALYAGAQIVDANVAGEPVGVKHREQGRASCSSASWCDFEGGQEFGGPPPDPLRAPPGDSAIHDA